MVYLWTMSKDTKIRVLTNLDPEDHGTAVELAKLSGRTLSMTVSVLVHMALQQKDVKKRLGVV